MPKFGISGPEGWGFTLWGAPEADQGLHRQLLERLAGNHPQIELTLPKAEPDEDCIEGTLRWADHEVWVWYEAVLNYLYLWSEDRAVAEDLRKALAPLARTL